MCVVWYVWTQRVWYACVCGVICVDVQGVVCACVWCGMYERTGWGCAQCVHGKCTVEAMVWSRAYTCTYTYAYTRTHTHTHTHTHSHAHAHTYAYTRTYTYIHVLMLHAHTQDMARRFQQSTQEARSHVYKTVALVPAGPGVDITQFTTEMAVRDDAIRPACVYRSVALSLSLFLSLSLSPSLLSLSLSFSLC